MTKKLPHRSTQLPLAPVDSVCWYCKNGGVTTEDGGASPSTSESGTVWQHRSRRHSHGSQRHQQQPQQRQEISLPPKGGSLTSVPPKHTKRARFKRDILYFCENTTIRGISRIAKTPDGPTKSLWITFFLILCVSLVVCLIILIRQFREYNVIHPPRVLRNQPSQFPSITLCNHRPLSHNITAFLTQHRMRNPRQFATTFNKMAIKQLYNQNFKTEYGTLTSSVALSGYLESIPLHYHSLIGHKLEDFIITCLDTIYSECISIQVTYQNGSKTISQNCTDKGKWVIVPHAQYINCFSYTVYPTITRYTTTIELYLYLDEDSQTSRCYDCFINNVKSQLSGALLVIHKSSSLPNINQEAINLQPGTLTDVRLKTFMNDMMTPPYGRCNPATPASLHFGSNTFSYTEHACKEKTIQQDINRECNCSTVEYALIDRNLSFCSSLSEFVPYHRCTGRSSPHNDTDKCIQQMLRVVNQLQCKSSVTIRYHNDIIDDCHMPCSYYSYESDRSISSWPTKTWQLSWLTYSLASYIITKDELREYARARDLFKAGNESEAMDILNNHNILEKKLVALVINKPNKNLHKVEEKAVLSLTSFLSQLGGLFSIWIGLTLISIVEIIELLLKLFDVFNLSENTDITNSSSSNNRRSSKRKNNNNNKSNVLFSPQNTFVNRHSQSRDSINVVPL